MTPCDVSYPESKKIYFVFHSFSLKYILESQEVSAPALVAHLLTPPFFLKQIAYGYVNLTSNEHTAIFRYSEKKIIISRATWKRAIPPYVNVHVLAGAVL